MPVTDRNGLLVNHPRQVLWKTSLRCGWLPPAQDFRPSEPLTCPSPAFQSLKPSSGSAHCRVGPGDHTQHAEGGEQAHKQPCSAQVPQSVADAWGSEHAACTGRRILPQNTPQGTLRAARSLQAKKASCRSRALSGDLSLLARPSLPVPLSAPR